VTKIEEHDIVRCLLVKVQAEETILEGHYACKSAEAPAQHQREPYMRWSRGSSSAHAGRQFQRRRSETGAARHSNSQECRSLHQWLCSWSPVHRSEFEIAETKKATYPFHVTTQSTQEHSDDLLHGERGKLILVHNLEP
jgi:hypothetical protein